jgi:hypothetical protein
MTGHRAQPLEQDGEAYGNLAGDLRIPGHATGALHCRNCGEGVRASPGVITAGAAFEYQHVYSRTVHCAVVFANGVPVALSEATASPCREQGCEEGSPGCGAGPYSESEVSRVAHEAVRALGEVNGDPEALPPWNESYADTAAVRHAMAGVTAEEQWQQWKRAKLAAGWRWGPRTSRALLVHSSLTEKWTDLPPAERAKDVLYIAVVQALTVSLKGATERHPPSPPAGNHPTERNHRQHEERLGTDHRP